MSRYLHDALLDVDLNTLGVEMKQKNSITDPWPMAVALHPREADDSKRFKMPTLSDRCGGERYVEWKRKE